MCSFKYCIIIILLLLISQSFFCKLQWIKLFDRRVRRYDSDFKPLPHEFFIERKNQGQLPPSSICFFRRTRLYYQGSECLLYWHNIFLSTCRNFSFTEGLGYEAFWGSNLSQYKYFWLSPQNIFKFDYLEDLVSRLPINFVSASYPSYHKHFYLEYGPLEYDLAPPYSTGLSFAINSNPMDF